ncbi:hypothetical protein CYY_004139 [Polysphondylium violaceum]|nr:hypothetical protein CYY_004139 [Polysphondylium violaceum]
MDRFVELSRPEGESIAFTDMYGSFGYRRPSLKMMSSGKPEIDRTELRDLFLDSIDPSIVEWDHHFLSLENKPDGQIEISFKNGKKVLADLVIGADGANSKVRPFVTDVKPVYAGITLLQSEVDQPERDCPLVNSWVDKGLLYALGQEKMIVAQAKGDGRMTTYATFKKPESWHQSIDWKDRKSVIDTIESEYTGWNKHLVDIFDKSTEIIPRPLYVLNQSWPSKSNITIVGDAAHVMPPFAGLGVNNAMLDALELVIALDKNTDNIPKAIQEYEASIFTRSTLAAQETKQAQEMLHSTDALQSIRKIKMGSFAFLSSLLPLSINTLNYITDLIGYTK